MFITWEDAKQKYPNKWVVFKNPQFGDVFHMDFIGGEFVLTADNQTEMFATMPNEDCQFAGFHTREDDAVGLLKSGF
ncbi:MAG: hypothetical protein FWB96_09690 [Defluviitaleaceae bacterium]|nr:hypothetical protein [Defluviitaleaceae bacterium]MCL2263113.1 hypothetical protein [Defluviitaleaceae bacterium]